MLTPKCDLATRSAGGAVSLGEAAIRRMHDSCPAAYLLPNGEKYPCSCPCHQPFEHVDPEAVLPVLVVPVAQHARAGAIARARGKRPTKAAKEATNACLCGCGGMCRARFLPGHDAKLKSRLVREARTPAGAPARLRLRELGWERFI